MPTVHTTVTQFNSVVNCSKDQSMTGQDQGGGPVDAGGQRRLS